MPSKIIHATAAPKGTESKSCYFANIQVRDTMRSRNSPVVSEMHNLQSTIGFQELVYWLHEDKWEGPFFLVVSRSGDVIVLLPPPSGRTKFRFTVVRNYIVENLPPNPSTQSLNLVTAHITVSGAIDDKDDKDPQCNEKLTLVSFDLPIYADEFPPRAWRSSIPQIV